MRYWGIRLVTMIACALSIVAICNTSAISADARYEIINKDTLGSIKCSLEIRIEKKVTKEVLQNIALDIKSKLDMKYDLIFINYYLPNMRVGSGSWATSHFNPDLKVVIQGLTSKQEAKFKGSSKKKSSSNVIGSWLSESPFLNFKLSIIKESGKLWIVREYTDGSKGKTELLDGGISRKVSYREKGNQHGEYYILDGSGNLSSYDSYGLIETYKTLR